MHIIHAHSIALITWLNNSPIHQKMCNIHLATWKHINFNEKPFKLFQCTQLPNYKYSFHLIEALNRIRNGLRNRHVLFIVVMCAIKTNVFKLIWMSYKDGENSLTGSFFHWKQSGKPLNQQNLHFHWILHWSWTLNFSIILYFMPCIVHLTK